MTSRGAFQPYFSVNHCAGMTLLNPVETYSARFRSVKLYRLNLMTGKSHQVRCPLPASIQR